MEILQTVGNALLEHWLEAVIGFLFMAVGVWYGRRRARKAFRKREFFHRLNISLNSIFDGKLAIRTISEKPAQEVFLNTAAVDKLLLAAGQTTEDDPLLPFDSDDHWFFLNSVLNEISEKFADGFIAREVDPSLPTTSYLICLTNECDGNLRTRKIRAMLIRRALLENLPEACPQLEQPEHATRWKTLQTMAQRWKENPIQFMELQLVTARMTIPLTEPDQPSQNDG